MGDDRLFFFPNLGLEILSKTVNLLFRYGDLFCFVLFFELTDCYFKAENYLSVNRMFHSSSLNESSPSILAIISRCVGGGQIPIYINFTMPHPKNTGALTIVFTVSASSLVY